MIVKSDLVVCLDEHEIKKSSVAALFIVMPIFQYQFCDFTNLFNVISPCIK